MNNTKTYFTELEILKLAIAEWIEYSPYCFQNDKKKQFQELVNKLTLQHSKSVGESHKQDSVK